MHYFEKLLRFYNNLQKTNKQANDTYKKYHRESWNRI